MSFLEKIQKYFVCFILYSVIGWLYEVFLEVVVYGWGFSNRGVLYGPYCVIYGIGALVLIFSLGFLKRQKICIGKVPITPVLVFLGIMAITAAIELAGSYIMEWMTGGWLWDYRTYALNFQGRIALNPSVRFGIGGMLFLYVLQPLFEKMIGKWTKRCLGLVSGVLGALLLADALVTFVL